MLTFIMLSYVYSLEHVNYLNTTNSVYHPVLDSEKKKKKEGFSLFPNLKKVGNK